jgi:hypothetical protein
LSGKEIEQLKKAASGEEGGRGDKGSIGSKG